MDMNKYQKKAMETATVYQNSFKKIVENTLMEDTIEKDNLIKLLKLNYVSMGLAAEAGEFNNQSKKIGRDDGGFIKQNRKEKLIEELGGILWYVAAAAYELNLDLNFIAEMNIELLSERMKNNTISGDGEGVRI